MDIVSFLMLMALLAVVGGVVDAVRKRRPAKLGAEPVRKQALYAEETLKRPADIAVELLTQHLPTLVEKSAPHIKRDDYGVMNLAPEFDGEIRYFVERVILTDSSYLRAAKEAMEIDPDARSRLFESSAIMERLVRNTLIGAYEDQARKRVLPASLM
jgi:hypothetical protein